MLFIVMIRINQVLATHVIFVTKQHLPIPVHVSKKGQDHYSFSLRPMSRLPWHVIFRNWDIFILFVHYLTCLSEARYFNKCTRCLGPRAPPAVLGPAAGRAQVSGAPGGSWEKTTAFGRLELEAPAEHSEREREKMVGERRASVGGRGKKTDT